MNVRFRGIYPALVTPLREDGAVNESAVAPLIAWMSAQGVDGFYVLGGTGEGGVLAEGERMRMAEAAAQAAKAVGKRLIVHVGAADARSALRLARHAGEIGADAVSSVYPNFFCRYAPGEAIAYYRALIEASGLPMLGYCQAMMGEADVLPFVRELMRVEGVIGVKYTFANYYRLGQIKALNGGDINVINGADETLLCGLAMGADGGIGSTYDLMPERYVSLYRAFRENDLAAAAREQREIDRVIDVALAHELIPAIRVALEAKGFAVGPAAFPARRYDGEERARILEEFRQAGLQGLRQSGGRHA